MLRQKSTEKVSYTASAANSAAIGVGIYAVRLIATSACHVKIGKSATATTSDALMAANREEIWGVTEGDRVSAIQNASGGDLYVTLLTR